MSKCSECGTSIGTFSSYGPGGTLCKSCNKKRLGGPEKAQNTVTRVSELEAVLLTTETAPNLPIIERIEIVTAECAFGMNIFKDLFAGIRDIVGGRSEAVQKTMRDARRTALYELKREAHAVGANAVVGSNARKLVMP